MKDLLIKCLAELEKSGDVQNFTNSINEIYDDNEKELKMALISGANGDNRLLNSWFFSVKENYSKSVPWLCQVKIRNDISYTWLVGEVDSIFQSKVRNIMDNVWRKISKENLMITPENQPPYISYMKNVVSSSWQNEQLLSVIEKSTPQFGRIGMFVESTALPHNKPLTPMHHKGEVMSSDIEIFQIGENKNGITEDSEWKMPLSSDFLNKKTDEVFELVKGVCDDKTIKAYEKFVYNNKDLITKLHTEIHNQGHFIGPHSYSQKSKSLVEYESIEEFRACMMTGKLLPYMEVNEEIKIALPFHVFLMRFLGYGLQTYLKKERGVVEIREMEVAALFYRLMERNNIISNVGGKICIDFSRIGEVFAKEVDYIHSMEENLEIGNLIGLRNISKKIKNDLYSQNRELESYYSYFSALLVS